MKIIITGATGFIGRHLAANLWREGHEIVPVTRRRNQPGIHWQPQAGEIDAALLEGADIVINLAGESVAERWNAHKKQEIRQSRIQGTTLLANTLASLKRKPSVFICASAIGYYGERGSEILTEDSPPGNNFLAQVCMDWEAAAKPAADAGIRTCNLRFGIVLSTTGGAFPRMLMPFQMGAGGRLGSGKQYMSWVTIDDTIRAIEFILNTPALSGPINVVAPNPVTNEVFTDVLGRVLHKPTIMPVPVAMAHLAFGREMPDQVLLASDRVVPEKLASHGFDFLYPQLQAALSHVIVDHV